MFVFHGERNQIQKLKHFLLFGHLADPLIQSKSLETHVIKEHTGQSYTGYVFVTSQTPSLLTTLSPPMGSGSSVNVALNPVLQSAVVAAVRARPAPPWPPPPCALWRPPAAWRRPAASLSCRRPPPPPRPTAWRSPGQRSPGPARAPAAPSHLEDGGRDT